MRLAERKHLSSYWLQRYLLLYYIDWGGLTFYSFTTIGPRAELQPMNVCNKYAKIVVGQQSDIIVVDLKCYC